MNEHQNGTIMYVSCGESLNDVVLSVILKKLHNLYQQAKSLRIIKRNGYEWAKWFWKSKLISNEWNDSE